MAPTRIPDIEATLQDETKVNLAKKYGKGILVLFSYPKANTGGCTRQTSAYGESYTQFTKIGAAVFGLSADSPKSQTSFKEKTKIAFDLISDPKYELIEPLGAKKSPKGVIRSHWVFKDGIAVFEEHGVKPEAGRALEAAQKAAQDTTKTAPASKAKPAKAQAKSKPNATKKTSVASAKAKVKASAAASAAAYTRPRRSTRATFEA